MNKVILCGRLTRDPEIRYTQGQEQTCIARYTLAVERPRKENGESAADFIPCVAFGTRGVFAEKYLMQGMKIIVAGKIQTGSYTNREGKKVYTTEVIVDEHEFAEAKKVSEKAQNERQSGGYEQEGGFMNIPDGVEDEGLPFN